MDLSLQLSHDGHVDCEGIFLGSDRHGSVVDGSDSSSEIGNRLGRELSFLGDGSGEFASVVLNVFNVSLDFRSELLEVLNDGRFDSSSERRVRIGNDSSLVSDRVEHVLKSALSDLFAHLHSTLA